MRTDSRWTTARRPGGHPPADGSSGRTGDRWGLVESLRERIAAVLRPLLAGCERVALIDFPNYPNVGDSAIYLGQLAFLRSVGIRRPCYVCDLLTYDRERLRTSLGNGIILLAGGGAFGDLWPLSQELREEIVASFPENKIIQLPQSIHFRRREHLERARRTIDAHRDFTLLARELRSLEIARSQFRAPSLLCPDMAFPLGPLRRPAPPSQAVMWLARTDKEAIVGRVPSEGTQYREDWLDEPPSSLRWLNFRLLGLVRRFPACDALRRCMVATYAPLARQRLRRGCRVLSRGIVVITDRLHGHILSLLLGIPHVVHDNSYGKLSSFYETWTAGSGLVRWADTRREALQQALEMSGEGRARAVFLGRSRR